MYYLLGSYEIISNIIKFFQKLVGEAATTEVSAETENIDAKQETSTNLNAEPEEAEEELPPRKKLRLEKKLRNAEFLFRRRKRDICAKMRQYESEWNNMTRVNNSLQRQVCISYILQNNINYNIWL